jgi:hydrogenase maturation protease
MGDEGVGVHAAAALQDEDWPDDVTVVDGGTGGFHLLSLLLDFDPVVMIDATMDGQPPGTVSVIRPRYASDFPRSLTAHDIGLRDLVEAASLVGRLPDIALVTISIDDIRPMETSMSEPVAGSVPAVCRMVRHLVTGDTAVACA